MDEEILFTHLIDQDHFRQKAIEADALLHVPAEAHGFPVFEIEDVLDPVVRFGHIPPGPVKEDDAVLSNLDEGRTFVVG